MTAMRNILLISILLFTVNVAFGQDSSEKRLDHFNIKKNVAIQGYDPVSYFSGNPTKGLPTFIHRYKRIVYLFSSEKNRESFIANPQKYEPAYGGWCAYAMALEKAEKVVINPKTYKIINDKLYLFYNKLGINTKEKWDKEGEEKLKNNADKNWNQTISK
jgi:YHS domain-containing protein